MNGPFIHRFGANGAVKAKRWLIPIKYPPFEALVAALDADACQLLKEPLSVA